MRNPSQENQKYDIVAPPLNIYVHLNWVILQFYNEWLVYLTLWNSFCKCQGMRIIKKKYKKASSVELHNLENIPSFIKYVVHEI